MTVDEFFAGKPESRTIFDRVRSVVEGLGHTSVKVSKSQIAFQSPKSFALVWIPDRYLRGRHAPLVLTLLFRHRDPSLRWKQVVESTPGRFTHHLELTSPDEVDGAVRTWLARARLEANHAP